MPFRVTIFFGIVTLCALSFGTPPFAAESKSGTANAEFRKMDLNKDGKVSAEEHAAGAKKMFDIMDKNKDGKVTATEMDAAHQRITGRKAKKSEMTAADKIKVVDKDGDGVLTGDEHAAGARAMFEKMDTDKDALLTSEELAAGHTQLMKKSSR